jgi:hypothetical protein
MRANKPAGGEQLKPKMENIFGGSRSLAGGESQKV